MYLLDNLVNLSNIMFQSFTFRIKLKGNLKLLLKGKLKLSYRHKICWYL